MTTLTPARIAELRTLLKQLPHETDRHDRHMIRMKICGQVPALLDAAKRAERLAEAFRFLVSNLDSVCQLIGLDPRTRQNIQDSIKVSEALAVGRIESEAKP